MKDAETSFSGLQYRQILQEKPEIKEQIEGVKQAAKKGLGVQGGGGGASSFVGPRTPLYFSLGGFSDLKVRKKVFRIGKGVSRSSLTTYALDNLYLQLGEGEWVIVEAI